MSETLRDLRQLYRDGRLIPFVGAGASMSVEWDVGGVPRRGPSWSEFADVAARELGFNRAELLRVRGTDLQIFEYFRYEKGSLGPLVTWMVRNMYPPDGALRNSPIHAALAEMDRCRTIYTTNFDNFIERALTLRGRSVDAITDENSVAQSYRSERESTRVVKFHGDWDHTESLVVTEEDFERRLRLEDLADSRLLSDLAGRAVLFVGYSFRDPNVSYLFRLFQDRQANLPLSTHGRRAYILLPEPSRFERVLFSRRNIEVVETEGGAERTSAVASILDEIRK